MQVRDIDVAYRLQEARGAEDARLLVMIHGLGQDHGIWDGVQDEMTGYRTLSYDIRGHGATTLGDANGTIDQLVDDLIALLEHFGTATLIGFSLGGVIALAAAAADPEHVEAVVAVATSSVVGSAAAAGLRARIALFERGDREAIGAQLLEDTRAQLAGAEVDAEAVTATRLDAIRDPRGYVNAARAVCALHDGPINDALARIAAPVFLVGGELDVWCPRRAAEIMLEHLPQGTAFEELPGVGHLITDVAPNQLTEIVRTWLERRDGP